MIMPSGQICDFYPAKQGDNSVIVLEIEGSPKGSPYGELTMFCQFLFFTLREVEQRQ